MHNVIDLSMNQPVPTTTLHNSTLYYNTGHESNNSHINTNNKANSISPSDGNSSSMY